MLELTCITKAIWLIRETDVNKNFLFVLKYLLDTYLLDTPPKKSIKPIPSYELKWRFYQIRGV